MGEDLNRAAEAGLSPGRADRLLAAMHKVLSHDLPNQFVAAQGLVNLLILEEAPGLTPEAREYLTRLGNVCRKAGDLVDFLRQMARIQRLDVPLEQVRVVSLFREVQTEVNQGSPDPRPACELRGNVGHFHAGARPLQQALVELIRHGVRQVHGERARVLVEARGGPGGGELRLAIAAADSPHIEETIDDEWAQSMGAEAPLEIVLARELIASWGGELRGPTRKDGVLRMAIAGAPIRSGIQNKEDPVS